MARPSTAARWGTWCGRQAAGLGRDAGGPRPGCECSFLPRVGHWGAASGALQQPTSWLHPPPLLTLCFPALCSCARLPWAGDRCPQPAGAHGWPRRLPSHQVPSAHLRELPTAFPACPQAVAASGRRSGPDACNPPVSRQRSFGQLLNAVVSVLFTICMGYDCTTCDACIQAEPFSASFWQDHQSSRAGNKGLTANCKSPHIIVHKGPGAILTA